MDLVVVPTTSLASNKPGSTLGSVALAILRRMEVGESLLVSCFNILYVFTHPRVAASNVSRTVIICPLPPRSRC